jgi:hypothetical protein
MRRGRIGVLAAALAILPAARAGAGDSPPVASPQGAVVVRETVDPAQAVVGQRVRLLVDVLFPDSMPAPPQVATPQAPGLQAFRFESQGLTMQDTIDSRSYAGQRFEFAVYPRRAGTLSIPSVEVRLMNRAGDERGRVRGEPQTLTVLAPPGTDPSRPIIASTNVTLKETWEPAEASKPVHVGDALVRMVTRQAADTPALGFPALDATAPQGVRVYVDQPQSDDKVARGDLTGERKDRITYVFEKEGDFSLAGLTQPWWDLSSKTLRKVTAPGRRITVIAAPPPAATQRDSWSRLVALDWRKLAAIAVGATVAITLCGMLVARLLKALRERSERGPSEQTLFRDFERAARAGDPRATWLTLTMWRQSANIGADRIAAGPAVSLLESCLFGADKTSWSSEDASSLVREIEMLRRSRSASLAAREARLPPLNPPAPAQH